jgi:hypothetical protein
VKLLIVSLWIGVAAIAAYWGIWFLGDRAWLASLDTREFFAFENAFPAADAWLALAFGAAAVCLQRKRPAAVFWLITCGSSAIYLGLLDVLFDLANRVYTTGDPGAVITELAINVASFVIGAWASWTGWSMLRVHRKDL